MGESSESYFISITLSTHPNGNTLPRSVCCSRFSKHKPHSTSKRSKSPTFKRRSISSSYTSIFAPFDIVTWASTAIARSNIFSFSKKKKKTWLMHVWIGFSLSANKARPLPILMRIIFAQWPEELLLKSVSFVSSWPWDRVVLEMVFTHLFENVK